MFEYLWIQYVHGTTNIMLQKQYVSINWLQNFWRWYGSKCKTYILVRIHYVQNASTNSIIHVNWYKCVSQNKLVLEAVRTCRSARCRCEVVCVQKRSYGKIGTGYVIFFTRYCAELKWYDHAYTIVVRLPLKCTCHKKTCWTVRFDNTLKYDICIFKQSFNVVYILISIKYQTLSDFLSASHYEDTIFIFMMHARVRCHFYAEQRKPQLSKPFHDLCQYLY